MPLYLIRWPHLDIHLIQAKDPADLFWKVEQLGDPSTAMYAPYTGPVCVRLRLPYSVKGDPKDATKTLLELAPNVDEENILKSFLDFPLISRLIQVAPAECEEEQEMLETIGEMCFPLLSEFVAEEEDAAQGEVSPRKVPSLHIALECEMDTPRMGMLDEEVWKDLVEPDDWEDDWEDDGDEI